MQKRKSAPRTARMEKLDIVIPKGIRALGAKIEAKYQEMYVLCAWERIVGKDIAKYVHPIAIHGTELLLTSMYGTWRTQLTYMQDMIIQNINRIVGNTRVKSIRFTHKRSDRSSVYDAYQETANSHKTHISAKKEPQILEMDKAAAREKVACIEDKELRQRLSRLLAKEESVRREKSTHGERCACCGIYIDTGERLCTTCERAQREKNREKLRSYLLDIPWATLAQIREEIDVTGDEVARTRAQLVQQLARRVKDGDTTSVDAKILVMLYRMVRPEHLTDDLVASSLKRLRYELADPFTVRGREKVQVRHHVSAHR